MVHGVHQEQIGQINVTGALTRVTPMPPGFCQMPAAVPGAPRAVDGMIEV
jgi:hypothetical protein